MHSTTTGAEAVNDLFEQSVLPSYLWQRTGDDFVLVAANAVGRSYVGQAWLDHMRATTFAGLFPHDPAAVSDMRRVVAEQTAVRRATMAGRPPEEPDETARAAAGNETVVDLVPVLGDCVMLQVHDVTEQRIAEQAARASLAKLDRRVAQQRAVAELGSFALRAVDPTALLRRAVGLVAEVLDIEVVTVLRRDDDGLRTVADNATDELADTVLPLDAALSQAALTLATGQTVVSADVRADERFSWTEDGCHDSLQGGVTTLVGGGAGGPFGVLCAHSYRPRDYDPDDQHFLVGVANVLAGALDRSAAEAQTRWAALHDPLTGLANRTRVLDGLTHALTRDRRTGACTAVLMIDLDGFKYVNDSLGHSVGDALLASLAPLLVATVRPSDTVARLGGDEFVVLCEDLPGEAEAVRVAERIAELWSTPLHVGGTDVYVRGSTGIAWCRSGATEARELLREADSAMYAAKERAPGSIAVFDATMQRRAASRLQLEGELRRSLEVGGFRLVYQPIVDSATGRPVGVEALARWTSPTRGVVSPQEFIAVAEDCGLIVELGRWVLREAVTTFAGWCAGQPETPYLTVNVSGRQLLHPGFVDDVLAVLGEAGLPPAQLGLEITESVLLQEPTRARQMLGALREAGVATLLDDFGTGYSSLSWLRQLPADALKIDRSFVQGLPGDAADASVVSAVVALGRSLGLTVIAEGVEDAAQLEALVQMGCPRVQGYLFARPVPGDEARATLFGR
ncbi:putative bifunctional diguanylate cyclase/phosphodiesterase [Motilibacter peucedani]|uniref:putative bifunctional diguanylate cyclase/phosphodiesterase n=1 Tax=Motilibacter peucedani TaxID=598650 RepID=UPI0011C4AA8C|nr:GGDEF domain-containing protein [Motilibacter peucedani]